MDVRENKSSSTVKQNIRLVLQFELECNGLPLHKEVMLDLEPYVNDDDTTNINPIHVINRTTAAIVQLLSGTVPNHAQTSDLSSTEDIHFKLKGFTAREMEVFTYLITGATNTEIAKRLGVSPNTIKFHVKSIFQKLKVKNRVELASKFTQM
ncbi:MAG: helix-turn-helix transcriptional regulator [Alicyclobacillus herbarius]|uniref:response regulator transcription factor n=1 Tax=Alicyclobacillus herbarius TaxID=122960 RepID=UPI002355B8F7|nr:helix-turn-helix transcriptional regulator [Alicyclobacillus herbarius]MCL6631747.1 helix-turn-helix transcriptional regulator [Alicyclobacillus herbarius]